MPAIQPCTHSLHFPKNPCKSVNPCQTPSLAFPPGTPVTAPSITAPGSGVLSANRREFFYFFLATGADSGTFASLQAKHPVNAKKFVAHPVRLSQAFEWENADDGGYRRRTFFDHKQTPYDGGTRSIILEIRAEGPVQWQRESQTALLSLASSLPVVNVLELHKLLTDSGFNEDMPIFVSGIKSAAYSYNDEDLRKAESLGIFDAEFQIYLHNLLRRRERETTDPGTSSISPLRPHPIVDAIGPGYNPPSSVEFQSINLRLSAKQARLACAAPTVASVCRRMRRKLHVRV